MNLYNNIMNNNEFEQLWKIFDRARYFWIQVFNI